MADIKAINRICTSCQVDVDFRQCDCNARVIRLISFDCDRCAREVVTSGGRDVDCTNCGACYNGSGQRLRDDWRGNPSNYNSDIGDLEGYEMQHAGD